MTDNPFSDENYYVTYLEQERHMYAWCLKHLGGMAPAKAEAAAVERYPYEQSCDKYRGLIFHDTSWHWAMLSLFGEQYWLPRPDLEKESPEYDAEWERLEGQAHRRLTSVSSGHE